MISDEHMLNANNKSTVHLNDAIFLICTNMLCSEAKANRGINMATQQAHECTVQATTSNEPGEATQAPKDQVEVNVELFLTVLSN